MFGEVERGRRSAGRDAPDSMGVGVSSDVGDAGTGNVQEGNATGRRFRRAERIIEVEGVSLASISNRPDRIQRAGSQTRIKDEAAGRNGNRGVLRN